MRSRPIQLATAPDQEAPQPPRPMALVIGIDLGTTTAAVCSFAQWLNPQDLRPISTKESFVAEPFSEWTGGSANETRKFPIVSMYLPEGNDPRQHLDWITGNQLEDKLKMFTEEEIRPERLFEIWKLLFYPSPSDKETQELQARLETNLSQLNMTKYDLLRVWVANVYDVLLQELRLKFVHQNVDLKFEVVVAAPPGRTAMTKYVFLFLLPLLEFHHRFSR